MRSRRLALVFLRSTDGLRHGEAEMYAVQSGARLTNFRRKILILFEKMCEPNVKGVQATLGLRSQSIALAL